MPRARPPEVPGGLPERRDWNQAGAMWVSWCAARAALPSDSCDPSKRPPVSAPGRKQPWQTPKDGERKKPGAREKKLAASN